MMREKYKEILKKSKKMFANIRHVLRECSGVRLSCSGQGPAGNESCTLGLAVASAHKITPRLPTSLITFLIF